ncbi:hypothetical protein GCM10007901_05970 [Dyella acidisoli]|uniref:Antitoxin Xre/MbcA/ParS-like toxin-binding domain-containing protein n=2 Tax=Dyella acidisoli TaxID=1867834 RepID=A0ABQ5XJV9_9GAMM|nr:hypothetical protein GCM10007901_05970 [Dyella acidisoli]
MDQETLIKYLGFGRSTLKRKIAANERLSQSESERVLGVTQLIVEVHRMVDESGETEAFDAAAWIGRWLRTPVPALKNRSPGEFLDTAIGQRHVFQIIRQMQSGAYV